MSHVRRGGTGSGRDGGDGTYLALQYLDPLPDPDPDPDPDFYTPHQMWPCYAKCHQQGGTTAACQDLTYKASCKAVWVCSPAPQLARDYSSSLVQRCRPGRRRAVYGPYFGLLYIV